MNLGTIDHHSGISVLKDFGGVKTTSQSKIIFSRKSHFLMEKSGFFLEQKPASFLATTRNFTCWETKMTS